MCFYSPLLSKRGIIKLLMSVRPCVRVAAPGFACVTFLTEKYHRKWPVLLFFACVTRNTSNVLILGLQVSLCSFLQLPVKVTQAWFVRDFGQFFGVQDICPRVVQDFHTKYCIAAPSVVKINTKLLEAKISRQTWR